MNKFIKEIQRIKKRAAVLPGEKALAEYERGIELLREECDPVENQIAEGEPLEEYRNQLARLLADFYGMAGGTLRRDGKLDESIKMYEQGYKIELEKKYNIQDSYNLTNRIIVKILKNPGELSALKGNIREGIQLIEKQVQGVRRDEWWAWADLGELYLLEENSEKARFAYERFREKSPTAKNYKSVIMVLEELQDALKGTTAAVSELIEREVNFLRNSVPSI